MFKKKVVQDLCSFSIQDIATGNIGGYILDVLHEKFKCCHIGYRIENIDGDMRCTLFTLCPANRLLLHYFQDRCSAIIENEVKNAKQESHSFFTWPNGFEEVCTYKRD